MPKKLIIILGILSSLSCYSQTVSDSSKVKEVQPEFVGGKTELDKFIQQNLKFPEKYKNQINFKPCKVLLKFIIDETGKITNTQIARGCFGFDACDLEALRIMSLMPNWIPAKKDNKAVKRSYSLVIDFKRVD
jgi:periplasmic protein TonB